MLTYLKSNTCWSCARFVGIKAIMVQPTVTQKHKTKNRVVCVYLKQERKGRGEKWRGGGEKESGEK